MSEAEDSNFNEEAHENAVLAYYIDKATNNNNNVGENANETISVENSKSGDKKREFDGGGVFFDNAQSHIDEVEKGNFPNLQTVKVEDSGEHIGEMPMEGDTPLAALIDSLGKNIYVNTIREMGIESDIYDEKSGVTMHHILTVFNKLIMLKRKNPKGNYYVMFDWDRTLTKFEGLFPESKIFQRIKGVVSPSFQKLYRRDMLRYLFGGRLGSGEVGTSKIKGQFRVDVIRKYIEVLLKNDIGVFILTNNGSCGSSDFKNTVKAFCPGIAVSHIICSNPLKGRKVFAAALSGYFPGSRLDTVIATAKTIAASSSSAATSGGTRKRRRNKKRTRRRASKKRN